ncbi:MULTISPECIES: response regulator [Bacillaceae]|uniref:Two-component system response regulator DcuR n=1 Tax=Gottfriedia luciferensis TaxID=178774 RepID=A0ABX2ZT09_9BACI|nr:MULTISPECIES: response regulator [Bacillaceae]ODG92837.1 two-component system response regulator DcuR [Gottfriedia luciferensis]PGZ92979.1 two-component system response regulator DcuR [Bacillus sp. AFS029533]SFD77440.1 two-component system, CitB family, response regulator MalR [Bacillus sp. UNCCL81]
MINVMIVEDDPMVAEINKQYLSKIDGFRLTKIANSVDDAILVLRKQDIHLILLDIFMPGKHGLELLTYLRKNELEVDVIIISAASDLERIKTALRYGVVDYLIKPFEFERFNAALVSYQQKTRFTDKLETVSQQELDNYLLHRDETTIIEELPKGLTKDTLKQIWEAVQELKEVPFSTEEVANVVGISRVSARKYMNFLKDLGILNVKVIYGTIGRPVYQHEYNQINEYLIKNFL